MSVDVEQLLDQQLEQIPGMTLGQLDNGLRYVILPNKVPPNRFEAHLEMHVGENTVCLAQLRSRLSTCNRANVLSRPISGHRCGSQACC